MSNNVNIKKIKLAKVKDGDGLELVFKRTDPDNSPVTGTEEHKGLIHPDLREATKALRIHLAILCGYVKESQVPDIAAYDEKLVEPFYVSGISLGGTDENPGITITGRMTTYRGKSQILNQPFELFDCAPESRYTYMDDLIAKVKVLNDEAMAYYRGEKRGTPPAPAEKEEDKRQVKMDFGDKATVEGNLVSGDEKYKYADKDAMARVAEMGDTKPKGKGKGKGKQQTPDNPSGE